MDTGCGRQRQGPNHTPIRELLVDGKYTGAVVRFLKATMAGSVMGGALTRGWVFIGVSPSFLLPPLPCGRPGDTAGP